MKPRLLSLALLLASLPLAPITVGCGAVYPELGTRTRPMAPGQPLDPPPPADMYWMRFTSAVVPPRTRDGRSWQASGDQADPYAKLFINGAEVLKTKVHSNTLSPTWPDSPRGNFRVGPTDKLRVEVWNSGIPDRPICVHDIGKPGEQYLLEKQIRVSCNGGAEVTIAFEPARAVQGAGFWYELRSEAYFISRVLDGSPAQRAGLEKGDQVLKIGERDTKTMSVDEVKSAFNAIPFAGLPLVVRHASGAVLTLTLKEGPIYPEYVTFGQVD
jgi:hypothetical protein